MNIAMEQTEVRGSARRLLPRAALAAAARSARDLPPPPPHRRLTAARPLRTPYPRPQEFVDGQLKNKYGDAFIRGNNVLYISNAEGAK